MTEATTINVLTRKYGYIPVRVEVHGLLGVLPHLVDDGDKPSYSEFSFSVVHLATGMLVSQLGWTIEEARALARDLARLPGWADVVRSNYETDEERFRAKVRETLDPDFVAEVEAILRRHRLKVRDALEATNA
jgi:hypothetical protein